MRPASVRLDVEFFTIRNGLPNAVEFFLGTDPWNAGESPRVRSDGDDIELDFTRDQKADAIYRVVLERRAGNVGSSWEPIEGNETAEVLPFPDSRERVKIRFPRVGGVQFLRLRVEVR